MSTSYCDCSNVIFICADNFNKFKKCTPSEACDSFIYGSDSFSSTIRSIVSAGYYKDIEYPSFINLETSKKFSEYRINSEFDDVELTVFDDKNLIKWINGIVPKNVSSPTRDEFNFINKDSFLDYFSCEIDEDCDSLAWFPYDSGPAVTNDRRNIVLNVSSPTRDEFNFINKDSFLDYKKSSIDITKDFIFRFRIDPGIGPVIYPKTRVKLTTR